MERELTDATKLTGLIDVHKNTILILQRQEGCALVGPLLITVTSLGVVGKGIDYGNGIIDLFFCCYLNSHCLDLFFRRRRGAPIPSAIILQPIRTCF
jgi:hypothetical protein